MCSVLVNSKALIEHDQSLPASATGLVPLVWILGFPWSLSSILGPGRTVNCLSRLYIPSAWKKSNTQQAISRKV